MAIVKTAINQIEIQLSNRTITVPCEVRLSEGEVNLKFVTNNGELHFQYALTGHELRLIVRDMNDDVVLSNVPLFNFQRHNPRLQLTANSAAN